MDPYYLTYRAKKAGIHPEVILAGRRINDEMGQYVAENTIKMMAKAKLALFSTKVTILGLTFKENCPDIRNTKVMDIYHELKMYHIEPMICDPQVLPDEVEHEYGIKVSTNLKDVQDAEVVILAVSHDIFWPVRDELKKYFPKLRVLIDVKSFVPKHLCHGLNVWCL